MQRRLKETEEEKEKKCKAINQAEMARIVLQILEMLRRS